MKTTKSFYSWFGLFALCFVAYQQVQDVIRPAYQGDNLVLKYVLGVAPNFFPAIGIPAFFVVLIPMLQSKWLLKNRLIVAVLAAQSGLIAWEFVQQTTNNAHFDWNDVLFTILGGLIFLLIWWRAPSHWKQV